MVGALRNLVSVLSGNDPFDDVLQQLEGMLRLTADMIRLAHEVYWGIGDANAEREKLYAQDIEVNRAERRIRKSLAMNAVAGTESDAMHALRLMSLVKDVERLGDYAKNLAELRALAPSPLPDDEIVKDFREIATSVDTLTAETIAAMVADDGDKARKLTVEGRTLAKRCDRVVKSCAASEYQAGMAVRVALGARFDKRIASHLLNILSSLIMPLHKLDFFDESAPDSGR